MKGHKKKGGHGGGGGGGGHDAGGGMRWLLTYADVVTLLLALFVYLFSISTVNVAKFRQFGEAFAEFFDFGGRPSMKPNVSGLGSDNQSSIQLQRFRIRREGKPDSVLDSGINEKQAERKRIQDLKQVLLKELHAFLDMEEIAISNRNDDLVLQLRDSALFNAGSAEIRSEMKVPLMRVALQIRALPNEVRVEGHTDSMPMRGGRFGSNWHLSGARAASVVDYLSTAGGIDPSRLSLAGYAQYRPLVPNYPNFGNPLNRRVEILILAHKLRTEDSDPAPSSYEDSDSTPSSD